MVMVMMVMVMRSMPISMKIPEDTYEAVYEDTHEDPATDTDTDTNDYDHDDHEHENTMHIRDVMDLPLLKEQPRSYSASTAQHSTASHSITSQYLALYGTVRIVAGAR